MAYTICSSVGVFYKLHQCGSITKEEEEELYRANYLSIGLIVVLPLLVWMNKEYKGNKKKFVGIIVIAIIFTLLAMIDIWVSRPWISLLFHIQGIFETYALVLLIYALYDFHILTPAGFSRFKIEEDIPPEDGGVNGKKISKSKTERVGISGTSLL
jgi:hypothetical protein